MVYRFFMMMVALYFLAGCSEGGLEKNGLSGGNGDHPLPLVLEMQKVIDFDHQLPNRIQNGSFELGIGAEPIYFGWRQRKIDDDMTPPDLPVIDHTTAMEGNASVRIAHILPNHNLHIDLTPPDITDELNVSAITDDSIPTSYMYADLKTDCPGQLRFRFPWHDARPTTEWQRYRAILRRNGGYNDHQHFVYDMVQRRIEIYNDGDQECTLWIDGLDWSVKDVGTQKHLRYAPIEAVFLPKRHDAIHFAKDGVQLRYRLQSDSNRSEVIAELHLRDLSRDGLDISEKDGEARYVKKLSLTADQVVEQTIDLGHLKRGAYMAHLAFYDPETKKILGMARNRFTVMRDLREVPPPIDFVMGPHGGLYAFGEVYEYSMRGSWTADKYYETAYLTGLRVQRLMTSIGNYIPERGVYNFTHIRTAINKAYEHNCTTVLCINPFVNGNKKPDKPGPGNWVFDDGVELSERVYGPQRGDKRFYRLPTDTMQELYRRVAREFGNKLIALENFNEMNMFYSIENMRLYAAEDMFKPIYDAVKQEAPNLPVVANFTMDVDHNYVMKRFMDGNGTKYSDGFTYHPYGRSLVHYVTQSAANHYIQEGIKYIKRKSSYRDSYKDVKPLIMGMTEIHGIATKSGVGWEVMQRALLDWSGGAKFSAGILAGGLYFLEAGDANDWDKTYTKAPGMALVALNGMHDVLGGYKLLRRVDWGAKDNWDSEAVERNNYGILIVLFQKPGTSEYAVALCQGDFHHKRALLNVTLPEDTKAFDQWGEPIETPTAPIKLSNNILYLKTSDPSIVHLFDDNSTIGWSDEPNGYDYKEQYIESFSPYPSDAWFKELLRTGIRPRTKRE